MDNNKPNFLRKVTNSNNNNNNGQVNYHGRSSFNPNSINNVYNRQSHPGLVNNNNNHNNNSSYYNRQNNNNNSNGLNNNTINGLNRLGVKTVNSRDVESKVMNKLDRELKENEIKELEKKLLDFEKEIKDIQSFMENNDDVNELLREEKENEKDDVLHSLKLMISLKKKRLLDIKRERDMINNILIKKKEELRVAKENKYTNGPRDDNNNNNNNNNNRLLAPSLFDMALGFSGVSANATPQETERERLIRTGKITPFDNLQPPKKTILLNEPFNPNITQDKPTTTTTTSTSTKPNRFNVPKKPLIKKKKISAKEKKKIKKYTKVREIIPRKVSYYDDLEKYDNEIDINEEEQEEEEDEEIDVDNNIEQEEDDEIDVDNENDVQVIEDDENEANKELDLQVKRKLKDIEMKDKSVDNDSIEIDEELDENETEDGSDYESESEREIEDQFDLNRFKRKRSVLSSYKKLWIDDSDESAYRERFMKWRKKLLLLKLKKERLSKRLKELGDISKDIQDVEEEDDDITKSSQPIENLIEESLSGKVVDSNELSNNIEDDDINDDDIGDDFQLPGGLTIPFEIYSKLFEYQVTGVRWLWELHQQEAGGVIGDEMGLGKTIQVIAFLASLHYSKMLGGPALIVAPATLLSNWVKECHKWWPAFRVCLFHSSSSNKAVDRNQILNIISQHGHILLTTYDSIRLHQDVLLDYHWEYVFLDEGHKIKNPDAEITLACKQFQTCHRVILSGSPIQNKLTELWSLFDFAFPGKLGTLPIFQNQFALPIATGAYSNSSAIQVQTAYKCAVALRDLVSPYMIIRLKSDVLKTLPSKNEQVLLCPLTEFQEKAYIEYLQSHEIEAVLEGKRNMLYGLDILKKISNHPDILHNDPLDDEYPIDYGNIDRSAKLRVVQQILPMWKKQNDKVLLFCQTRQMLDIVENFIKTKTNYQYFRMDGTTSIKSRQALVEEFNENPNLFIFLLTTKVGGLGLNLTGANRVILFDPDWNPSTDIQARERVYRIGQKKMVTIYRLITLGTIEEKIYHRQIYKQFLTNKILKDPRQKRFFKSRHLKDLFTYSKPASSKSSETADYFSGSNSEILPEHLNDKDKIDNNNNNNDNKNINNSNQKKKKKHLDDFCDDNDSEDSDDEIRIRKKKKLKTSSKSNSDHDDDSLILKKLFEKEGLSSALKHDVIMGSTAPERSLLEQEAQKIANKAVILLKKSREFIEKQKIGTLTWTGKYGLAGLPSLVASDQNPNNNNTNSNDNISPPKSGRFGNKSKITSNVSPSTISKQSIVSINNEMPFNILNNNANSNTTTTTTTTTTTPSKLSSSTILSNLNNQDFQNAKQIFGVDPNEIIEQIFNIIVTKGGSVSTQVILSSFSIEVSDDNAPLLKTLLKNVADFNKITKKWSLKTEFLLK